MVEDEEEDAEEDTEDEHTTVWAIKMGGECCKQHLLYNRNPRNRNSRF